MTVITQVRDAGHSQPESLSIRHASKVTRDVKFLDSYFREHHNANTPS